MVIIYELKYDSYACIVTKRLKIGSCCFHWKIASDFLCFCEFNLKRTFTIPLTKFWVSKVCSIAILMKERKRNNKLLITEAT